ncbi:hypothetical protein LPJ73_005971, partial [Coemansia sp. RSA 2703]
MVHSPKLISMMPRSLLLTVPTLKMDPMLSLFSSLATKRFPRSTTHTTLPTSSFLVKKLPTL